MNNTLSKPAKLAISRALLIVALLLGAFYAGFPVVWMVASSFK